MSQASDNHALPPHLTGAPTDARATPVPPGLRTFGLAMLLASLTVLFAAAMVGYTVIRLRPEMPAITLPFGLWLSSFTIFLSSAVLHYASLSGRAGRYRALRGGLLATLGLGVIFLCLQVPSLSSLAQAHRELTAQQSIYVYALVVMLVILHGLHVIGGLIPLSITTVHALQGRYDGGDHQPVKLMGMYWHFLAIVWLVMFSLFLVLR